MLDLDKQTPHIKEELPKHTIVRESIISTTGAEARERERERINQ